MKILIVGLGSIAQKHIAALKRLCTPDFYAWRSSPNPEKQKNITNVYSITEIKKTKFDFVLISNPTSAHADTILKLLEINTPFFIEKPLFHSLDIDHKNLVDEIGKREIANYVACNLRFLDSIKEVKSILKDKTVNEVNSYCGSYLPNWRPSVDFRKVYSANKELGGGVHLDMIHELDYLHWLFGTPGKTTKTFRSSSSLQIDAIDYANFLWEYPGFSANIVLNYYRKDTKRTLEIVTANNTYNVDLLNNRILEDGIEIYKSNQTLVDTYTAQMKFFINEVLTGNSRGFNDVEEAYQILNLCLQD